MRKTSEKMKISYEITPLGMLNNAKIWYFLYRQNINLGIEYQVVATYCLLIGLEMYLKSYLIALNKNKYSYDSELRKLGHSFKGVVSAIQAEKGASLFKDIEFIINKYELSLIDTNNLRYPKRGDSFIFYDEYLKPRNDFDMLIEHITSAVSSVMVGKFYEKD